MAYGNLEQLRLIQQKKAIVVIQRNARANLKRKNGSWWKLFRMVRPMLKFSKRDELLKTKEEELQTMAAQLERLEHLVEQEVAQKHDVAERLREKAEVCVAVEAECDHAVASTNELPLNSKTRRRQLSI